MSGGTQSCVQVVRNFDVAVRDVWAPSELQGLEQQCDALKTVQQSLDVPSARTYAVRFSLFSAPFETLHAKWSPVRQTEETADHGAGLSSASLKSAKVTAESRLQDSEGVVAEQSKNTYWFRFTTSLKTREYVVERAQSHLLTLLSAIEYSFPHMLVWSSTDATPALASLACKFLKRNEQAFAGYLPVLFFLLETQEKVACNFFLSLDAELTARRNREATLLEALRPKTSKGWFSWGSSSKRKAENTEASSELAESISFMDANVSVIPVGLKSIYLTTITQKGQLSALVVKQKALHAAVKAETQSLEEVATSVSVSPQTNEPIQAWYTGVGGPELLAEAKESAAEMKRTAGLLQQVTFATSNTMAQVAGPLHSSLQTVVEKAFMVSSSMERYLAAYLTMKRFVVENEPFISGKAPLVKGCPAASSPGLFKQVADVHQYYASTLKLWEKVLTSEIDSARGELCALERKICSYLFTSVNARLESFDERHHSQLLSSLGSQSTPAPASLSEAFEPAHLVPQSSVMYEGDASA